jgi:hypothetical protein
MNALLQIVLAVLALIALALLITGTILCFTVVMLIPGLAFLFFGLALAKGVMALKECVE